MTTNKRSGYSSLKENKSKIIAILRHDNKKYRQLVLPTLYYIWMIYRYLHPCNKNAEKFLYEKTHILNNKIADYEQKFIKFSNIPVFYHKLNQKDLLGYNNEIIVKNYFQRSSLYWIEKKINYLSSKKIKINVYQN